MKKHRTSQRKSAGISALLLGVIINAAAYLIGALVFSVIAYSLDDPIRLEKPLSLAALLISGAASGFAVAKKSEKPYTAVLSSLAFAILLLLVGIMISGGAPKLGSVINLVIYVAVCAVFSRLACVSFKKRRFRR